MLVGNFNVAVWTFIANTFSLWFSTVRDLIETYLKASEFRLWRDRWQVLHIKSSTSTLNFQMDNLSPSTHTKQTRSKLAFQRFFFRGSGLQSRILSTLVEVTLWFDLYSWFHCILSVILIVLVDVCVAVQVFLLIHQLRR